MLLSTRPNINDMDKGINKHRRPRLLIDTLPEDRMDSMNLDPEKLDAVAAAVRDAGRYAYERQGAVRRTFKKDGSVLTDVDMAISHSLISRIHDLFPGAAAFRLELTPCNQGARNLYSRMGYAPLGYEQMILTPQTRT